jgi:hypothetical protein
MHRWLQKVIYLRDEVSRSVLERTALSFGLLTEFSHSLQQTHILLLYLFLVSELLAQSLILLSHTSYLLFV